MSDKQQSFACLFPTLSISFLFHIHFKVKLPPVFIDIMSISPNTMKAVDLLNSVLSEAQENTPPLPPPSSNPSNKSSTSTSALNLLSGVIGEMEAVTCHKNTSAENLGRQHTSENQGGEAEQPTRKIRRGASREIATTITRDLKRSNTETETETETVYLKRSEDHMAGRRDPVRRAASNDLSATVTGGLKRPGQDEDDEDWEAKDTSGELICSPTSQKRGSQGNRSTCFGKSESISEETEEGVGGFGREKDLCTTTASLTPSTMQYAADALTVNWLDLRVGRILSATKHESAEKLYCESIDVGESEPRSIASGLVPYYSLAEMQDRLVVVVCNLKSRNLVGFPSNGMVLCATAEPAAGGDRQVELLCPPVGAKPGDRVFAPGVPGDIVTPQKCDKKKIFPKVAVDLKVDANGRFMWDGMVLSVGDLAVGEACSAPTLRNTEVG